MNNKVIKIGLLIVLVFTIATCYTLNLEQYATLDYIKAQKDTIFEYYQNNTSLVLAIFGFVYVLVTALSLPVATMFTLIGGALFGLPMGLVIVSFASTIGATLAFLIARFLARDYVQRNYRKQLSKISTKFEHEGSFYLFALRLVPVLPFFMINIIMAIMPIKTWTFYWVSQIGMLPSTTIYVYAGTKLIQIKSLSDVASPSLLITFTLLGLFPLITKNLVQFIRKEKTHEKM